TVLLGAVGLLILSRQAIPGFPLGAWIAHYWPVLLILWGLTRLLEHLAGRSRGGLSGGEVLLLVLIVVFGLAFSGAYRFRQSRLANYWGINVDTWNPFYESHQFSTSASAALPPGAALPVVVRGYRGNVSLLPGPSGSIQAAVSDTVRAVSFDEARRRFDRAQPLIRREGGQWVVLPTGDATPADIEADLKLTLPAATPVTVETAHGDFAVSNWKAGLDLHATHGTITASGVAGNVQIESAHSSITLDQIAGNVVVSGSGGDLTLTNVQGDATIQGEFTGSLSFRNLARGLHFNSERTALAVASLPGTLSDDIGEITITNARGISLRTRDAEIAIRRFSGPLEVHGRNDSISLSAAAAPADPITVTNLNADITLNLPAASRFQLDARTRNGEVHNAFSAEASQAPGPLIHLETTNGDITVAAGGE
ncbi:MAG: DUF4097 family beta strand repeat-containing protein, partial [Terriglobales bacterium]